ncbi:MULTISPECIES: hypothetical protein [Thermocrispum]|uniref:DUF485 domain-containing protein n=1 Tax=Thermocrispum agreste TaxID=37925 RepID=A0A2W4LPM4_9PSEU|nr:MULTISPECIES: hypothetical protein [Thermocrispum]PZM99633.1 MAG: hypothetical protein DIU77_05365 [Thermocrispum agreste]
MTMAKRVAVMSPQTRLARSRRRLRGRWRMPRLDPDDAERALRNYRLQRRRGVAALVLIFAMLLGLPLLLRVAPGLTDVRLLGIPVSWLVLAVLPYPLMSWLAGWQLRRAERVEDGTGHGDGAR